MFSLVFKDRFLVLEFLVMIIDWKYIQYYMLYILKFL